MRMSKQIRWFLMCGVLGLALLTGTAVLAQGELEARSLPPGKITAAGDWLHFGYDSAYTAYNPNESAIGITNVTELERRWGIGCDDGWFSVIFRSPAIYGSTLYTSGAGTKLTAYDAHTGQFQWQFGDNNAGWAPQPIVSEDGIVIYPFDAYPTYLYAVNGQTGTQIWKAPVTFDVGYSGAAELVPTIDEANDLVYLLEEPFMDGGKLWAIDLDDGEVAWWMGKPLLDAAFVGSYPLLAGGKIYAAADVPMVPYPGHGEHMLRIDPATQTIELTYERPTPESYWSLDQYTLCNDRLVVGFDYQSDPIKQLVAYDIGAPDIAWQKPISYTITGKIACNPEKDVIYVPTNPYLYALDAATGEEVWKYLGYGAIYNPSVANGVVYLLSDSNMYALDEETGKRLFHYDLGYNADETTQVAIAHGMVYFSGNGGTCDLYALGMPPYRVFLPLVTRGQ